MCSVYRRRWRADNASWIDQIQTIIRNRWQDWIVLLQDFSQDFHVVINRFLSSAQFLGPYGKSAFTDDDDGRKMITIARSTVEIMWCDRLTTTKVWIQMTHELTTDAKRLQNPTVDFTLPYHYDHADPIKLNLVKKTKKQYVKRTFFDIHCLLFTALRGTSSA
jgi:hypothetical protein